jgi:hypothetical protein
LKNFHDRILGCRQFEVLEAFMTRYKIEQVGGAHHTEWWIPAEDIDALNENIVGLIEVIREFER